MKVITIGRLKGNDVVIDDEKVSRFHLQIVQFDDGSFHLVDFGSTNGSYVNGVRVEHETVLQMNDFIRIGDQMLPWTTYFEPGFVSQAQSGFDNPGPTKEHNKKAKFHIALQALLWILGIGNLLWAGFQTFLLVRNVIRMMDYPEWISVLNLFCWIMSVFAYFGMGVGAFILLVKQRNWGFYCFCSSALVAIVSCVVDMVRYAVILNHVIMLSAVVLSVGLLCAFLLLKKDGRTGWNITFGDNCLT